MTITPSADPLSEDMHANVVLSDKKPRLKLLRQTLEKGSPLIVAGAAACGCAYVGLSDPEHKQIMPVCGFYAVTGYYCPGCGMTRAVHNLLHFNFLKAVQFNLLIVVAIPVLVYLYAWWVTFAYTGKRIPGFKISRKWAVAIALCIVMFVVGRNLPLGFAEYFARDRLK